MAFFRDVSKSLEFRVSQLKALFQLVDENRDVLVKALKEDFRKVGFIWS